MPSPLSRAPARARLARRRIAGAAGLLAAVGMTTMLGSPARGDASTGSLPGGTDIAVSITTPADGATVAPGTAVAVTGTASVAGSSSAANTAVIYVLDLSGSTVTSASACGDQNADVSAQVVDCEIAAAIALNNQGVNDGSVSEVGAAVFANVGATADVSPPSATGNPTDLITTPAANANANTQRDIDEVLRSADSDGTLDKFTARSVGTQTNFEAGVQNALTVAAASTAATKIVAFMSDGAPTMGGSALDDATNAPANVFIHTFAVGPNASCTNDGNGQGSLEQIAKASDPSLKCTTVSDPTALPDILPDLIKSKLDKVTVSVNGGTPFGATTSETLPKNGPVTTDYSYTIPAAALRAGVNTVCVTAHGSDAGGPGSEEHCHEVIVNSAPQVDAGNAVSGAEGSQVVLNGSTLDADGDSVGRSWTYAPTSADPGATCTFSDASANTTGISCTDDGSYTATLTADDGVNAPVSDTTMVTITNAGPQVTASGGGLYALGTPASVTANFSDAGTNDSHVCNADFEGTPVVGTVNETNGSGACSATHTFGSAGVYTVTMTITDDDGASGSDSVMVVVYDPSAGFVTGGGTIDSPAGAYVADPAASGRANFGFVSKYQKGKTTPSGSTEFQFKAGGFNFHSDAYEWLVVSGPKAQYKGTGSVNGVSGYGFLLTATDGQKNGGGGADKFRIKVWNTASGMVVYDNQPTASDDLSTASPQVISSGSIVIHT